MDESLAALVQILAEVGMTGLLLAFLYTLWRRLIEIEDKILALYEELLSEDQRNSR